MPIEASSAIQYSRLPFVERLMAEPALAALV
jgi:hypothetical protein